MCFEDVYRKVLALSVWQRFWLGVAMAHHMSKTIVGPAL